MIFICNHVKVIDKKKKNIVKEALRTLGYSSGLVSVFEKIEATVEGNPGVRAMSAQAPRAAVCFEKKRKKKEKHC